MDKNLYNNGELGSEGSVKISTDVVISIAGVAAREIEGVVGIASGISGGIDKLLGKKGTSNKGIKVVVEDGHATIDLDMIVNYGCHIPTVAEGVQEKVKDAVENMTGIQVDTVNVHITGVDFNDLEEKKEETAE